MCGIVGYVGQREAEPILLEGLRRLEYRGYDSAGMATLTGRHLHLRKKAGRIADLGQYLRERPAPGCHGISHTRWATHGPATDSNAHPHVSSDGQVAVVHNGVIENYCHPQTPAQRRGLVFRSDTDTEVIAQLIALHLKDDLVEAVHKVLGMLKGTYGLAVVSTRQPDVIVGARLGSPLVVGIGQGEHFLASDPSALLGHTEKVVYLHDHQMCVLRADGWNLLDADHAPDRGRGAADHLRSRRRRQGRLRALHAQGDLRAARSPGQRHARPAQRRGRHAPTSAASTSIRSSCAGPSASS